eukprot:52380-Karenia_brevis.AAC.1
MKTDEGKSKVEASREKFKDIAPDPATTTSSSTSASSSSKDHGHEQPVDEQHRKKARTEAEQPSQNPTAASSDGNNKRTRDDAEFEGEDIRDQINPAKWQAFQEKLGLKRRAEIEADEQVPIKKTRDTSSIDNIMTVLGCNGGGNISRISYEQIKQILREVEEDVSTESNSEALLPQSDHTHKSTASGGVAEIYSQPRVTEYAEEFGLRKGWALDLHTCDIDGREWDFNHLEMRQRAIQKIDEDKPMLVVLSPMCAPFSTLQNMNYAKGNPEEVREKLRFGIRHLAFAIRICRRQLEQGRYFIFEHPQGVTSWQTNMRKQLLEETGVRIAKFDMCMFGMKTVDDKGNPAHARKRTAIMTNSIHIAREITIKGQCDGKHKHAPLIGGRAKACEVYPPRFCKSICRGMRQQLLEDQKRAKPIDVTDVITKIIAAVEKNNVGDLALKQQDLETPHEEDNKYSGYDFYDDASGAKLDKAKTVEARALEMKFFRDKGVYTKVPRSSVKGPIITTRWLDVNKGDESAPDYRSRLVGREIKRDSRMDLFAATPPLE